VYLNIAGGYRVQDPAADLAVAAALISALADKPLPKDSIYFGEIALSGEVRAVAHQNIRLREAGKLGFSKAVSPIAKSGKKASADKPSAAISVQMIDRLAKLVDHIFSND
jgi:DNA repair protein RadA/Sms